MNTLSLYKLLRKKSLLGFSLVELLITMIISTIVLLSIGMISTISNSSYNKVRHEADIYNDISHGLKFIQNKVHSAQSVSRKDPTGNWKSEYLLIDNTTAVGVYPCQSNCETASELHLAYFPDTTNTNVREILLKITNVLTNDIDDPVERDVILLDITSSSGFFTLTLSGRKSKVPFNIQTKILKRVK